LNRKETPSIVERLGQLTWGFAPPLILEAAVRCRVFDALGDGPKTAAQVAAATGAAPRGLRALLNSLVGLQLARKDGETYWLPKDVAEVLVRGRPGYRGDFYRHGSTQIIPAWLHLAGAVQTGKPAKPVNQEGVGGEFFREFVEDLFANNYEAAKRLADALNVASATAPVPVLDVAAGSGVWSIALAEKSPQVQVAVVDWPAVIPVCRKVADRRGVGDRYRFLPGDLLATDFGDGFQIAILGHILHSEGEERSRALLRKTFRALAPGGTVVIAEMIPDALLFAVNMLVFTEAGDVFSFREMRDWLHEAGFANVRQLEAPAPSPLVLARKPK